MRPYTLARYWIVCVSDVCARHAHVHAHTLLHTGHTLKHTLVGHKYQSHGKALIRPETGVLTHTHTHTPWQQQSESRYFLRKDDRNG